MMQQLGKYTVIRRLGVGGMAEVFLCKLVGIGGFEKHVVLKKIRADIASDDEFITMFFDEARLAANLNHPNIIQVFEVDQLDGTPYLAMEYVRGATLAAVHKKLRDAQTRMEFGHLAYIFAGVCAGLDHAHNARDASGRALNIVHRDISPQNIIISLDGTPKIFDFGVAKARGSLSLTGANQVKGKFGYMAPEQLRAKPVDAKADVYAVGVCMYEAVTGRRPFSGGTEAELYAARLEGKFRMPSEHVPTIPVELEHLILSAMAPDPADRPTALELQEALATFCAVGSAHPSSTQAVVAWLKELLGEEASEPYEGYSTANPSMTSVPRSANLAPTGNAVEATQRRTPFGANRWVAILGGAALVLAAVLVTMLLRNNHREPVAVASTTAPTRSEHTQRSAPAAARLAAPAAAPAESSDLRAEVERMRAELEEVKRADDEAPVREMTVADGRRDRAGKKKAAPQRVAVAASKAAAPASKPGAGSGAGSAIALGATALKPGAGSGAGSAAGSGAGSGAGSAQHVAAQVTPPPPAMGSASGSAVAPAKTAPARVAAMPAPSAPAIANPGTLDAVPSLSKLSVDGSLTTTEVQSALARTLDALRGCYRSAARKANHTPEVSIKVSFEIDEGARAGGVRISGDSLGLGACAKDAIGGVRTRVAPDVGTVSVSAVVRFRPTR